MHTEQISLLLVDDHPIVRHGLRILLSAEPDLVVVGELEDGVRLAEEAARLQPDVVVLDVMLPGASGLKLIEAARQASPSTRVVVLSMYSSEAYVVEAMRSGAMAYVVKSAGTDVLVDAVRTVMTGRKYLSSPFSERAIEQYTQRSATAPLDVFDTLTNREAQVLKWMVRGHKNAEIARNLSISARTVEVHRARVMQKLGLSSTSDLIQLAVARGMLSDTP